MLYNKDVVDYNNMFGLILKGGIANEQPDKVRF